MNDTNSTDIDTIVAAACGLNQYVLPTTMICLPLEFV